MKLGPFIAFGGAVGGMYYQYSIESELDFYILLVLLENEGEGRVG